MGQRSRVGHAWREPPESLGANAAEYAARFALRYRNNHPLALEQYPLNRVADGETFTDVVVEVRQVDDPDSFWVHRLRSLIITDAQGQPELLALILSDATEWASAEQRFEKPSTPIRRRRSFVG